MEEHHVTHPLAAKTASRPIRPKRVDCVFENGTRFGPFDLLAEVGPHAIVGLADGTPIPLPIRAIASPRKAARRVSSGERTAAR
jgi:hypothetical protein